MPKNIQLLQPDEIRHLDMVKNLNPDIKNPILIDVGINFGDFTGTFLSYFPDAICYGIDPIENLDHIKKKFLKGDNVYLYNIALGEKKEKKVFYDSGVQKECSSFYDRGIYHTNIKAAPKKHIVSIEKYDNLFGDLDVFYLKIDTEGYEEYVIRGAKKSLEKGLIKYIQFEYGLYTIETGIEPSNLIPILYDRYKILDDNHRELPIDYKKPLIHDVKNFLAIRRNGL